MLNEGDRRVSHEAEPQPKTAWIFPGQGVQFVGMGKDLYEKDKDVRALYKKADKILGYSLSSISFEDPDGLLNQTRYTQPAIFVYSHANMIAAKKAGKDFAYPPIFVAGHSFGEYNALVAAGALTFEDALKLVSLRAKLTQGASEKNPGGMMVVKSSAENQILKEALKTYGLELCVDNADDQVVIGGSKDKLLEAGTYLKSQGLKNTLLNISGAFHTRLMKSAVPEFQKTLEETNIKTAKIPIIANTTALPIQTQEEIREELVRQLTGTVRWREIIQYLESMGVIKTLEIGKKGILSNINKAMLGGAVALALGVAAFAVWRKHEQP